MNSLINLMTMIGVDKTLIITSGQSAAYRYSELPEDVAFFFLPENMLQRYNTREKEQLQTVIDRCGCTQLLFLAILDEEMIYRLTFDRSFHALRAGLNFQTALLPACTRVMDAPLRNQVLIEQHVATQCSYLMEYHFVREKVHRGQLMVRGVVGTPEEENYKTVCCNGVRFDDLVSMN